ncbi:MULTISPECIES: response regulator [Clostridia]|uniref:response regulator n=1 Tax=Clostridia TaxID=186801 RepID=UPI000EA144C9|nr:MULTISPECIES: response regulator [Clostridia]NBJ68149.1 response regulator [Roseburia sp. 1XD42-34]RKI81923.1 response regulator [Clostridium sp. 1xD42-85]
MIKIVIAEDDFRVADIHEQFLLQLGDVEVVGKALNGEETIKLIKNQEVHLLLLDIYMPDILGVDLLPNIRKISSTIDIIMITAATDIDMVRNSLDYGVFDYIIKPLKMERFLHTIQKFKQKKNLLQSYASVSQEEVDQLFRGEKVTSVNKIRSNLPKGIDPLTLEKVKAILKQERQGITAEEMGIRMGASRTTARRYLEYLISMGEVDAELEYGIVGRPERKYIIS